MSQSQYSQMSDSQLKQTINQLQTSAGATPRFPTWQHQLAPATPGSSSWQQQKSSANTRARSRPTRTGTSTPVAAASYAQPIAPYQQPTPVPPPPTMIPPPPTHSTIIPSTHQAKFSMYPSRLRTGATLLMQPIIAAPVTAVTSSTMRVGRAGKRINYAEAGSGDEDMDVDIEGKEGSDESDYGGRRAGSRALGTHHTPQPQQTQKAGLDQSYLGMIPPSRFIVPKVVPATPHTYFTEDAMQEQAQKPTTLVPIRVELETETHRIRDAFVWNLNERLISPAAFAKIFCADLDLPLSPYAEQVEGAIRAQIEEWEGVASMNLRPSQRPPPPKDPAPFYSVTGEDPGDSEIEEWELLGEEYRQLSGEEVPDCRVLLEIDVQIATQHLSDHIEWDLLSPLTPEEFARTLCSDLGLGGESIPLIAHAVHEEILRHKRDAIEWNVISVGDASGEAEEEKEKPRDRSGMSLLKDKTGLGMGSGFGRRGEGRGPRPLRSVFRDWSDMEEWGTKLEELTAEEVERREIERERAARRLRRETSRFQHSTATVRFRRR